MRRGLMLLATFLPSSLRILLWRLLGFKVGKNCHIGLMSIIVADELHLGDGVIIAPLCFLYRPSRLVLGDRCRIAGFVRIIGYGGEVELEAQSFVALGNLIDCTDRFVLGARSQLGPRGIYYTHGGTGLLFNKRFPHKTAPIEIGADSWIAMGVVVQPGVRVGEGSLVLPGAVLYKDVPPGKVMMLKPDAFEVVPVEKITDRVSVEALQAATRKNIKKAGEQFDGGTLEEGDGYIIQPLAGGWKRIVLLFSSNIPDAVQLDSSKQETIVWCLEPLGQSLRLPTFVYSEMTIHGPQTRFVEQIAEFLCDFCGVHFVYANSSTNLEK